MSYAHAMSYDHSMSYDHAMSYDYSMSYAYTMSYAYNIINEHVMTAESQNLVGAVVLPTEKTVLKVSGQSGNLPDGPESFQTDLKVSRRT